jgi:methylated-DNA-protein-cysteine methyltransferase-like protein
MKYESFYRLIKKIPRGRVATYGQIARLAGVPGNARQMGYALAVLSQKDVPWHRVVNAQGRISARAHPFAEDRQRRLLEKEKILFNRNNQIALSRFQWKRGKA